MPIPLCPIRVLPLEVLKAQVIKYDELPNEVVPLVSYCQQKQIRGNAFDKDSRLSMGE